MKVANTVRAFLLTGISFELTIVWDIPRTSVLTVPRKYQVGKDVSFPRKIVFQG